MAKADDAKIREHFADAEVLDSGREFVIYACPRCDAEIRLSCEWEDEEPDTGITAGMVCWRDIDCACWTDGEWESIEVFTGEWMTEAAYNEEPNYDA